MIMFAIFSGIFNVLLILLISPLFMTIIKKVKARTQRRAGPPLMQGYWNLAKLFRKEVIYSDYSSPISRIAPYASLAILIVASLMVPIVWIPSSDPFAGNIIIFLSLLAAGRLLIALLGLDAGSTFGGMGSSREMSLSAVIEPTTVVVFAAMAYVTGTLSIPEMFRHSAATLTMSPTILLLSVPLFILIIVETGRIPVDNPETHLELTMIHEGMLLDTSGRNLALFELSHAVKQTILMALLLNILIPFGLMQDFSLFALFGGFILFMLKGAGLSVLIGIVESSLAKMRFFRIPNLFMMAFFFAVLTIFSEVML